MLLGLALGAPIVFAFFLGLQRGMTALILLRPLCDRLFEAARFDVSGHAISFGALINMVVIGAVLINVHNVWRRVPFNLMTIWLPFLLLAFVAVLYSPVPVDGLRKWLTYVTFFAVFNLSFVVAKSEWDILYYLKLVIFSSVVPALYGLFQAISRIDLYQDTDSGARIHSTFSHPNIFAFQIVVTIGVILFLLASDRVRISGRLRFALQVYLIPLLLLLIMTKTRSAWVGCFIIFLVYGMVYDKRVLIFVLVSPFLALAVPAISDRIMDLASRNDYIGGGANINAYAWRQILWEDSLSYIIQRPLFGYGLDSFRTYSVEFWSLDMQNHTRVVAGAHNVYIQFVFEMGLVGLISLLLIFCQCFARLARYWYFDRRGATMAAALMLMYLAECFSDNVFEYVSFDWNFWFIFGLILAGLTLTRRAQLQAYIAQNPSVFAPDLKPEPAWLNARRRQGRLKVGSMYRATRRSS
jgi:O-antigen ligase